MHGGISSHDAAECKAVRQSRLAPHSFNCIRALQQFIHILFSGLSLHTLRSIRQSKRTVTSNHQQKCSSCTTFVPYSNFSIVPFASLLHIPTTSLQCRLSSHRHPPESHQSKTLSSSLVLMIPSTSHHTRCTTTPTPAHARRARTLPMTLDTAARYLWMKTHH